MILLGSFSFGNIENDHLIIVGLGYVVCFICLAILWGIFINLPTILEFNPKALFSGGSKAPEQIKERKDSTLTGEEAAAITAAIHLFIEDLHDEENRVLTIQKISRRYSPWSSKIYSVTNGLNKRF